MKKIAMCTFFCVSFLIKAQKITTTESEEKFNAAARNAICSVIFHTDTAYIFNAWNVYLKNNKCKEIFSQNGEVKGHNVLIKEISLKPIDVYTKFELNKEEKTTTMHTAVDIGAGNYIKSDVNPQEIKALEKLVILFALNITKGPIEEFLKSTNDFQQKLNKEINDLEKHKNKLGEDTLKFKSKINKAEDKLKIKGTELVHKTQEAILQKKINDTITAPESERAKTATKIYNKLIKEQKQFENQMQYLKIDVSTNNQKLLNLIKETKLDTENQLKKKEEIETQKKISENLKTKLKEIS